MKREDDGFHQCCSAASVPDETKLFCMHKGQTNSLPLVRKEPGAWLSLSGRRHNKTQLFSPIFSLAFILSDPTALSLPYSFSRHYLPSRISYHTCTHCHSDLTCSHINHAMGHLLLHINIWYLPCWILNSWQRGDFFRLWENCKPSTFWSTIFI